MILSGMRTTGSNINPPGQHSAYRASRVATSRESDNVMTPDIVPIRTYHERSCQAIIFRLAALFLPTQRNASSSFFLLLEKFFVAFCAVMQAMPPQC
jgi:hypothetical protein